MNIRRAYQRASSNLGFLTGSLIVIALFGVAVVAPILAPPVGDNPYEIPSDGFGVTPTAPDAVHPLGTIPPLHLDVYYGLVWGTRAALRIGLQVALGRLLIGVVVGLVSGFLGGFVDSLLMRITDAFLAFPILAVAMVFMTFFGNGRYNYMRQTFELMGSSILEQVVLWTLIGFGWMQYARLIRANVLTERSKEYIFAAITAGVPRLRILFRHLLPNSIKGLFVLISSDVGTAVVLLAVLNFIGLTSNPGNEIRADWGQMLSGTRDWIVGSPGSPFEYWYLYVPPSLAIVLFSFGWNLIGDGLDDLLDPVLR